MMNTADLHYQEKGIDDLFRLLEKKEAGMSYYSPYSFLRDTEPGRLCRETFIDPLRAEISSGKLSVTLYDNEAGRTWIVSMEPAWDSEYFRRRIIKIEFIMADHDNAASAGSAIKRFTEEITGSEGYVSVTIPCEDLFLVRAMSHTGFRLVETRLNYYFDSFDSATAPSDPVRWAERKDIPALKDVAVRMRNRFDRVHADPAFSPETADAYLGTFIEESVKGFADIVMVPDISGVKPFGFLAADFPVEVMGRRIAKLVLAAVDNSEYRGWLSKLLTAVIYQLKVKNTDILTTITQASNRPAIRTWEKAGFKLGFVTHVYTYSR
ncbi:MAG TPA: hypothetical protein P5197_09860 [Bacteroidales bacterium]|nr:hypothetical protein [Bacteroidales bacterium]